MKHSSWLDARDEEVLRQFNRERPLTENQKRYADTIRSHPITLVTGPAGTAKTYVACKVAIELLNQGRVKKIVLSRPQVECGPKMGFLPGTDREKLAPYLRPLMKTLAKLASEKQVEKWERDGVVEVYPMTFMRGDTHDNAIVIVDEAQNCEFTELKMVLTRLGENSKIVLNGDVRQTDLKTGCDFLNVMRTLSRPPKDPDIGFAVLTGEDVMRPRVVRFIDDRLSEAMSLKQAGEKRHGDVSRSKDSSSQRLGSPSYYR